MSLFVQLPEDYPVVNDEYFDSIQDKLWECACETFSGTDSFYDGACFAEDGPSLKALTEYAVENYDDGKLEYWQNYNYTDGIKDHYATAKYVLNEYGIEYGSQITPDNVKQYNEAISMLIGEYEWSMAENMYEYLTREYPSFGMIDDVLEIVEKYDTYDDSNSGTWRQKYLDDEKWCLTVCPDENLHCEYCAEWNDDVDKVPHFIHVDRERIMSQVGCSHAICAVCGDGS